ncbi:hypothetical protein KIPB_002923 [Kipferlia bialata]|uniref:RING-type domain-containing protein n=1 Tax=Kipferlia bialata TaxID=797122 RepID=A0A9K3GGS1_9EUKA|nr:hypothetical protein KIPB_002923 [Kipferlia bialata]|eukprot:g2923.t1
MPLKCQICGEDRPLPFLFTPCQHVFHTECLGEWLDGKDERVCPVCREECDTDTCIRVKPETPQPESAEDVTVADSTRSFDPLTMSILRNPSYTMASGVKDLKEEVDKSSPSISKTLDRLVDRVNKASGIVLSRYARELYASGMPALAMSIIEKYGSSLDVCTKCAYLVQTIAEEIEDDSCMFALHDSGVCETLMHSMHDHGYPPSLCVPVLAAVGAIAFTEGIPDAMICSPVKQGREAMYKYAVVALMAHPADPLVVKAASYYLALLLNVFTRQAEEYLCQAPLVQTVVQCAETSLPLPDSLDTLCQLFECLTHYAAKAFPMVYDAGAHVTALHMLKAHPECVDRCHWACAFLTTLVTQAEEEEREEEVVTAIVQAGAIPLLLAVLDGHADNAEVLEACLNTLASLMSEDTAPTLFEAGTHVKALKAREAYPDHTELAKTVCRHIGRMAEEHEDSLYPLLHLGTVPMAKRVIEDHTEDAEAVMLAMSLIDRLKDTEPEDETKAHLFETECHDLAIRVLKAYPHPAEEALASVAAAATILWNM